MPSLTGGATLVAALEAHGVHTVFGIPGTHNLSVFSALAASPIHLVLTRHEQGAGYAADGYARVSGQPGVCLTTTGPAILNALAAAAQAWSDSVPVLFISPGMPLTHPGRGNGYLHEVKDQHAALDAVVAYSHRVTSVEEIPAAVAYAFAAMRTGRPRPVHLEVPLDLLEATAAVRHVTPVEPAASAARDDAVEAATDRLRSARRPVMIVGGGARTAVQQIRGVAERLNAPVLTTANGKGTLDESHALCVGAGLHHPSARALLDDADTVLAIGTELAPSDLWNGPIHLDDRLIRIDVDCTSMITNADPAVRLVGDAPIVLGQLLHALGGREGAAGDSLVRAEAARQGLAADAAAEGAPWEALVDALSPVVDEGTVVAGDSTMACYYGALTGVRVHRPAGFLYPTGGGTLGYGLPAAIGASLAPKRPRVIALLGDGGAMFTLPELATAAALGLSLPVVVVDNGGYGEIRNEMADRHDPVHSVRLGGIDFPAAARAMGCRGRSLESPTELTAAVQEAFTADRPTLLHLREDSRATQG
ncbi:thiamine pyrophosphate-binding protein [Leekyejoonella antrihumi]|uniref:Acetolactate synthase n=1 Tax=Leekyejoonella antrihumi TaxID=1660198 RepID=A0A563E3Y7_9MICO|nr:thiamine pyrophosphate-binding protein [Leekyejoonella antrihumi]TWP37019.1 acetolactate synthase [Leekyejoonella antrihumi]